MIWDIGNDIFPLKDHTGRLAFSITTDFQPSTLCFRFSFPFSFSFPPGCDEITMKEQRENKQEARAYIRSVNTNTKISGCSCTSSHQCSSVRCSSTSCGPPSLHVSRHGIPERDMTCYTTLVARWSNKSNESNDADSPAQLINALFFRTFPPPPDEALCD